MIPVVTGAGLVQQPGGLRYRIAITGTTAAYADVTGLELLVGTFFDESQERSKAKVVILGPGPVTELFGGDAGAAIGSDVRIGRTSFRVIGVTKPAQQNDLVIMPLEAARSYVLGGDDSVDRVLVEAASGAAVPAALEQVNAILGARHNIDEPSERDFEATAQQELLDDANQFLNFLTLFTTAIAGISLVVGGIGVANIMLVSVTERTREIGIRKAIGATRRAILQQFLLESTVLAGLGGLIGVVVGVEHLGRRRPAAAGGGAGLPAAGRLDRLDRPVAVDQPGDRSGRRRVSGEPRGAAAPDRSSSVSMTT